MLSLPPNPAFSSPWDHRPNVPSPLASSPVRASSPLSPVHNNAFSYRQIQSSPIQPLKFRYASKPMRPNPVVRRPEEAQESRRKRFLQGVRDKSDDRAWLRRDVEGQFLKNTMLANIGQLSHDAPEISEADIEDAMGFRPDMIPEEDEGDGDDMMIDHVPDEETELEAIFASYEEQRNASSHTRQEHSGGEDEEYDALFAELIAKEQQTHPREQEIRQHSHPSSLMTNEVDMMDEAF